MGKERRGSLKTGRERGEGEEKGNVHLYMDK